MASGPFDQILGFEDSFDWYYDNPPQASYFGTHAGWFSEELLTGDSWKPPPAKETPDDGPRSPGSQPPDSERDTAAFPSEADSGGVADDPVVFDDVTPPIRESDIKEMQSCVSAVNPGPPVGGGKRGPRVRERALRDRRALQASWEWRRERRA